MQDDKATLKSSPGEPEDLPYRRYVEEISFGEYLEKISNGVYREALCFESYLKDQKTQQRG